MPDLQPLLVSKKECARLLGVSVRTVENLLASKQLFPTRRVGRRVLIPYRVVSNFSRSDHATGAEAQGGEA
jgi:excisionase family DNA binding protein